MDLDKERYLKVFLKSVFDIQSALDSNATLLLLSHLLFEVQS